MGSGVLARGGVVVVSNVTEAPWTYPGIAGRGCDETEQVSSEVGNETGAGA